MWRHFEPASDFAEAALVAFYVGGCMRSGGGSGFMCGGLVAILRGFLGGAGGLGAGLSFCGIWTLS